MSNPANEVVGRRTRSAAGWSLVTAAVLAALPSSARAIVYRNDVTDAQSLGLANQDQFKATGIVGGAGGSGTGTLILPDWVVTAKHVVGGDANGSATASFSVGGVTYNGQVYSNPANDFALIHLTSGSVPVAAATPIAPGFFGNEAGKFVWLVGYGGHGPVSQSGNGGASLNYDFTLHAGTNVVREYSDPFLYFDNANTGVTSSVYESSTAPGDSGGPMYQQVNNTWYVIGEVNGAGGNGFTHTPTNANSAFTLNTIRTVKGDPTFAFATPTGPKSLTWDSDVTVDGTSDGGGTWDIQRTNFRSAATGFNYQWDNAMNNDVTFGTANGAAGTVTIAATNVTSGTKIDGTAGPVYAASGVSAHSVTFNPAASGSYTLAGTAPLTLVSTAAGDPTLTANVNAAISAPIAGTAATLTKAGVGTLTLSGANTFTGKLLVTGGTLAATSSAALPTYATAGQTAVSSGATLAVSVGGGAEWTAGQLDALRAATAFDAGSALGVDTTSASFAYASALTGNAGLTKLGANTFTSSAANTYAGPTLVQAGTLKFSNAAGLPAGGGVTVRSGGTLEINGFNGATAITLANPMSLAGTGAAGSRGALSFTSGNIGTYTLTGGLTLAGSTTIGSFAVSHTVNFNAPITGTGSLSFNDEGGSVNNHSFTANFNAASSYVGNTNLASGNGNLATFKIGVNNALPTGTLLTLTPAAGNLTFNLNGHAQTVAGLASGGTAANATVTGNSGDVLTLNTAAGSVTYAGKVTGGMGVAKTGVGTQVLSGAGTYTGATNVSASTRLLTGTLGNTAVTVGGAGTLAGTGSVAGSVSASGLLAPGNAATPVGTLTTGGLTLADGAGLAFDLGTASGGDLIASTTLTLGKNVALALATGTAFDAAAGKYSLIDYTGALTNNSAGFAGWSVTGLPAGTAYAFALGTDSATSRPAVNLLLGSAVPEPAGVAGVVVVAGCALRRRRRSARVD